MNRSATIEDAAGIDVNQLLAEGAAVGGVVVCTAAKAPVGVATETQSTQNGVVNIACGGVIPVIASEAIAIPVSGVPVRLVAAAGGKVQKLPSATGTYYQVGWLDFQSPAAGADGDIIGCVWDPDVVYQPSVADGIGAPATPAEGDILNYDGADWVVLNAGTDEQVLVTQGAAAQPKWLFGITTDYPASQAQGDVFYRSGSALARLAAGTKGQQLVTGGAAANPAWGNKPFVVNVPITTATSQTGLAAWGMTVPAGYSLRVDTVTAWASGVTATLTVDVTEDDTTILSAAITPVADTVTAGTVTDASVAAEAELNIIYTTGGSGAGVNLNVTITGELIAA